jgi:vesicle-fusing ATPase
MGFQADLLVGNLPNNKLALTNKIFCHTSVYDALVALYTKHNVPPVTAGSKAYPILLNGKHPYIVEGRPDVEPNQLAFNGLQRRFAQLSLAQTVTMVPLQPYPPKPLASLEIIVNTLASPKAPVKKPKDIDSDRLLGAVITVLEGFVIETGQSAALDFEGTKFELTFGLCTTLSQKSPDPIEITIGQILHDTVITFARAPAAKHIVVVGNHVSASGGGAPSIFVADFDFVKLGIGGLDAEFNQIFRRAFASRIWPSSIIQQMGITHVRGMLLFGPPGCGKTLIARQIGKALNSREPKIVNGPEILNKYVGGSEEKIRELFAEAEKEQLEMGDASMLHIVIMDEMDAICKQRGSVKDGTGVSDSVVNQLLSKIDGVNSLNNILLIGMTNRKDMIDDALLRPGRLEVHVEIGLPDEEGRLQILNIHTQGMRKAKRVTQEVLDRLPDIAAKCKNFSGAELEGLVKAASSYALTRCVDVKDLSKAPDVSKLIVEYNDFELALGDVEPKFGAKSTELKAFYRNGIISYGEIFEGLMTTMKRLVQQVRTSDRTPLMSVLLRGPAGVGKTAIAAKIAVDSEFPFVRMISADEMIGYGESSKCQMIHKVFMDSYKSPLSLIIIDDLERIIDYVPTGPRFSNTVLQTLLVLLKKIPPDEGRRLMVIATTSAAHLMEELGLTAAFGVAQPVPMLQDARHIARVLRKAEDMSEKDAMAVAKGIGGEIGMKQLLMVAEMAKQEGGEISVPVFMSCLTTVGL